MITAEEPRGAGLRVEAARVALSRHVIREHVIREHAMRSARFVVTSPPLFHCPQSLSTVNRLVRKDSHV